MTETRSIPNGIVPLDAELPDYLRDLNPNQRKAALHFAGPILVLAGAGSGKTRVLTKRIIHLVKHHNIRPSRILAVTFTNKATNEMRERLTAMLGSDANDLWVSTFHSCALRMLRSNAKLLGYSSDFVVYDEQDAASLMKQILKDMGIDPKEQTPSSFLSAIDKAKNQFISPEEYLRRQSKDGIGYYGFQVGEVYSRYQQALLLANAMDFGDLLVNGLRLLREQPHVRQYYQNKFQFVLVDEFQDTNFVQYEFVSDLVEQHSNLFVVGDDDQSIYAFRGATIKNILEFEQQFEDAEVVTLDQNYRSTGNILAAANGVIAQNSKRKEKQLWTESSAGAKIIASLHYDEDEEASFVVKEVRAQVAKGKHYSDIAIFYRTNAQSRALEEAFVQAGLPYRIFGGLRFYERKEIKDLLAYIRIFANPSDVQAFLRIVNTPTRGIGAQGVKTILTYAANSNVSPLQAVNELAASNPRSGPLKSFAHLVQELSRSFETLTLSVFLERLLEQTGYLTKLKESQDPQTESRLENINELQGLIRAMESAAYDPPGREFQEREARYSAEMQLDEANAARQGKFRSAREVARQLLDRVALTGAADQGREESGAEESQKPDSVSMLTLHLAKGLEFPVVFFTGLEEGLVPHSRSIDEPGGIEEERRLCYVGITRAMEQLYLTRASMRVRFDRGGAGFSMPSRFYDDIPEQLITARGANFSTGRYGPEQIIGQGGFDDDNFDSDEAHEQSSNEFSSGSSWVRRRKSSGAKASWKITSADKL